MVSIIRLALGRSEYHCMLVEGTGDTIWTICFGVETVFEARSSCFDTDSPEAPLRWETLEKVISRMMLIGGDASYFALGTCGVDGLR